MFRRDDWILVELCQQLNGKEPKSRHIAVGVLRLHWKLAIESNGNVEATRNKVMRLSLEL